MPGASLEDSQDRSGSTEFHPIIYAAMVPTVCMLFGVAILMLALRGAYMKSLSDFGLEPPRLTVWMIAATSHSMFVFLPPLMLSLLMVWYAHRAPTARALCVVVGCMTLGVGAAIAFYIAMILPLLSIMTDLAA